MREAAEHFRQILGRWIFVQERLICGGVVRGFLAILGALHFFLRKTPERTLQRRAADSCALYSFSLFSLFSLVSAPVCFENAFHHRNLIGRLSQNRQHGYLHWRQPRNQKPIQCRMDRRLRLKFESESAHTYCCKASCTCAAKAQE